MAACIGETQLAAPGGRAEFPQLFVLELELGKTPAWNAARERRGYARIRVAGLNPKVRCESNIDRHLHNDSQGLALDRMSNADARKGNVFTLHLGDLGHFAELLRWRSWQRLALHDPIGIGCGGALRRVGRRRNPLLWRRVL